MTMYIKLFLSIIFVTLIFAGFQSIPTSVSAQTQGFICRPDDYGPLSDKDQWCACAAQNGDTGSLMRERCSQAPRDQNSNESDDVRRSRNPENRADRCEDLATSTTCNQTTYNRCGNVKYSGNRAYYDCYASQNSNCQGRIYCAALDRANVETRVECPDGTTQKSGSGNTQSTIVCLANANANSNNNSNDNRSSSSSSSYAQGGSANVTINSPAVAAPQPARTRVAGVNFVKELPKTGLPILAWVGLSFIPMGARLKRVGRGMKEELAADPNFIWQMRRFNQS